MYMLFFNIGISIIGLLLFLGRRPWVDRVARSPACGGVLGLISEGLSLLALSALIAYAYQLLSPQGFLSWRPAIEAIQDSFVFASFEPVGKDEIIYHEIAQDAIFIDARFPEDYAPGHLKNAININPTWTKAQCAVALNHISKSSLVVLYCQSSRCPYSKMVGQKMVDLGYKDVRIYENGWEDIGRSAE